MARLLGEAGHEPIDLTAALDPVLRAAIADARSPGDLARLRVVCDWIQYRRNFREPLQLRPVVSGRPDGATATDPVELAVDLRRTGPQLGTATESALREHRRGDDGGRLVLEEWAPTSQSLIWSFNTLYWQHLQLWEQATGRGYESALPGGRSDARNVASIREIIRELFAVWDALAEGRALPEELYILELGVGNGSHARTWLDTFVELDRAHGRDYYRRLHYLMCDYSPHVLELARTTVAEHAAHVSSFVLDAMHPMTTLGFLRFKAFLVYISNVYDNLPTDEIASIGQREHLVQTRAYLSADAAAQIAGSVGVEPSGLGRLVARLLKLGPVLLAEAAPDHFADVEAAVAFWRACWQAVRLQERYVPLHGLDTYDIAPGISGELLRPLVATGGGVRMHAANGAVASFAETLPLLHPYGWLRCHDLFVTGVQDYRTGFRGPGKYDGSVVNWVNGPLLAHIGTRKGFDVTFAPFAHRTGSNIVTMTVHVRD
ncbi:SAM-dependent methyltransferase [Pseudonocardia asaccharolytica]|uniref:SAM-dependent methyltransferase n=1 Tax=Pseudonocardia asaccharolytica TaxID=54010 RepID=UPI00041B5514|nr:SAM-dependent methyltransferase [Pseudonocardia asaccharolytica]